MKYKIWVIQCPHCGHEKVLKDIDTKCLHTFTCKKCKHTSSAKLHQEIFEFENLSPVNMQVDQK